MPSAASIGVSSELTFLRWFGALICRRACALVTHVRY